MNKLALVCKSLNISVSYVMGWDDTKSSEKQIIIDKINSINDIETLKKFPNYSMLLCKMKGKNITMDKLDNNIVALQDAIDALNTSEKVYEGYGFYFAISDGEIYTISTTDGCSPKGNVTLTVATGLTQEEQDTIQELADEYGVEDSVYYDAFTDGSFCGEETNDEFIDVFEDDEDDETVAELKAIIKALKKTKWKQLSDFLNDYKTIGLTPGRMYYEWDGEWIDFYDDIITNGSPRGINENLTDEEWIKCISNYIK